MNLIAASEYNRQKRGWGDALRRNQLISAGLEQVLNQNKLLQTIFHEYEIKNHKIKTS